MTAKIIKFPGIWYGRVEPDEILKNSKGDFKDIVLIGECPDGAIKVRTSDTDNPNILWLIKQAELHILGVPEPDHDVKPAEPDDAA